MTVPTDEKDVLLILLIIIVYLHVFVTIPFSDPDGDLPPPECGAHLRRGRATAQVNFFAIDYSLFLFVIVFQMTRVMCGGREVRPLSSNCILTCICASSSHTTMSPPQRVPGAGDLRVRLSCRRAARRRGQRRCWRCQWCQWWPRAADLNPLGPYVLGSGLRARSAGITCTQSAAVPQRHQELQLPE